MIAGVQKSVEHTATATSRGNPAGQPREWQPEGADLELCAIRAVRKRQLRPAAYDGCSAIGGAAALVYAPAGSICWFDSPLPSGVRMISPMQAPPRLQAKRILVVEDELMIRMLLEDMLGELGYTIAAEAARVEEALEAAKHADFDLAILDVNLNGQPISPVADALVARGMPFVFATGYGERGLPEPYRDRPTLKKPFQMDGLKHLLQNVLDQAGSGNLSTVGRNQRPEARD